MANIVHASQATQVAAVRALFSEYARAVDAPCCFVGLERELAALPGEYAPPAGRVFPAPDAPGRAGRGGPPPPRAAPGARERPSRPPANPRPGPGPAPAPPATP